MKRDLMMCKRIMLQLSQNGHFISETKEEAYHVALLVDRGYVDAKIEYDPLGTPLKATIGRMTAVGHDALEGEFAATSRGEQDAIVSPKEYYNILVANKHNNETTRDKMLATIATGGMALLFGIASYLKSNGMVVPLVSWLFTLSLWALVLIGLLFSCHIEGKNAESAIEKLNDPNADVMHRQLPLDRIGHWLNVIDCIAAVLGIGTFTWFIIQVV